MANKEPYQLSASLDGHSADVRCVSSSPLNSIVFSSSRDGTARSWIPTPNAQSGSRYSAGPAFTGQHDGFLNACCWIAGPEGGSLLSVRRVRVSSSLNSSCLGYLVTGGQDKLVAVWPLPADLNESSAVKEPSHLLVGHEGNVCAIHASQDGRTIVSGSWDKRVFPSVASSRVSDFYNWLEPLASGRISSSYTLFEGTIRQFGLYSALMQLKIRS